MILIKHEKVLLISGISRTIKIIIIIIGETIYSILIDGVQNGHMFKYIFLPFCPVDWNAYSLQYHLHNINHSALLLIEQLVIAA